jgi:hypothetical protein
MSSMGSREVLVSSDPYILKKEEFELEVTMQEGYSFEEFQEAVLMMDALRSQYGYAKPKIIFKEQVKIYYRKKYHEVKEFDTYFMIGDQGKELIYSARGRSGFIVKWHFPWKDVDRMILVHSDRPDCVNQRELEKERYFNRIRNARFDEITWSNLKKDRYWEKKQFYYIKKVFDSCTMEQIRKSFEQKKDFQYSKDDSFFKINQKRHYKVEGKMCEDGIYRAWFSSEYIGCANGDYYLLLNPEVAVFCEKN